MFACFSDLPTTSAMLSDNPKLFMKALDKDWYGSLWPLEKTFVVQFESGNYFIFRPSLHME